MNRRPAVMKARTTLVFFGIVAVAILIVASQLSTRGAGASGAEPFLPAEDGVVLERLPAAASSALGKELRALRAKLSRSPADLKRALSLARRYIEEGRARSDPRYLGRAQAALARWWDLPAPPPEVRILRATVRQSLHDFEGALTDLAAAIRDRPNDPQAWITRSVILQVQGRYDDARESCRALTRLTAPLVAEACMAAIEGLTGQSRAARARLEQALEQPSIASRGERMWALTILAEIAARTGHPEEAERRFREALRLSPTDGYLLAAMADTLLDAGRPAEVVSLLHGSAHADGLLLRLAIAEAAQGIPSWRDRADDLEARFAASRSRGDDVHRREEARLALALRGDAVRALRLARESWAMQREPWDARLYLEAALAARDPVAATPVLEWLARTRLEDRRLEALQRRVLRGRR